MSLAAIELVDLGFLAFGVLAVQGLCGMKLSTAATVHCPELAQKHLVADEGRILYIQGADSVLITLTRRGRASRDVHVAK